MADVLVLQDEIDIYQERLTNLSKAKAVLVERAKERFKAEKAEYEAKLKECEEKVKKHRHKLRGRTPQPPQEQYPRDKVQYNFTNLESRIMKNATHQGYN